MKTTTRQRGAKRRLTVALAHVQTASNQVEAAMADLSTVNGASRLYNQLREILNLTKLARHAVDMATDDAGLELDHEPTPQELRCGHGPDHGCGGTR